MRKSSLIATTVLSACVALPATCALFAPVHGWAQASAQTPITPVVATPPVLMLGAEQAQADVALLRRALETIHPGLYRRTSRHQMDALFADLERATKQPISDTDFYRQISLLLAEIRCNHTKAEQTKAMETWRTENPSHLPFRFRLLEGRMIVESSDPSQPALAKGVEVLSINGRSVPSLVETLGAYVPIDGDTLWARSTNLSSDGDLMGSDFDHFYPYVFGFEKSFVLQVRESETAPVRTVQMSPMAFKAWRALPWDGDRYRSNFADTPTWKMLDKETAYLRIITFVNYRNPVDAPTFYEKIFAEIQASGAKRLVLDLRDNGGGSGDATYTLTDFLAQRPFVWNKAIRYKTVRVGDLANRIETWGDRNETFFPPLEDFVPVQGGGFDLIPPESPDELLPRAPSKDAFQGPVTILTSPVNGSGSTMLIAKLRDEGRVRLVGGRSGGSGDGPTAGQIFNIMLPNSGIAIRVPNAFNAMQVTAFERSGGITPDVLAEQRVADYRAGIDTVLQAALVDRGAPMAASETPDASKIIQSLSGSWRGTLEYRDFGNDKRETLPTTLDAKQGASVQSLKFDFTYDDGPGKTVRGGYTVNIDLGQEIFTKTDESGADLYRLSGASDGLPLNWTLWGRGIENGVAVDVKETLTVSETALTLLRETRSDGGAFTFRHRYSLTR